MSETKKKEGIIINRMYVGDYLSQNLGHEVINLIREDNGRHYLYLNQSGSLSSEHSDHEVMLMVRYEGNNMFEIVGMAKGLEHAPGVTEKRKRDLSASETEIFREQKDYIEREGIFYNGISILELFGKAGQQNVFVTFKAKEVRLPKDNIRIFLEYNPHAEYREENGNIFIPIKDFNLPKTSLKSYITPLAPDRNNGMKRIESEDYGRIMEKIVNNTSLWEKNVDWDERNNSHRDARPVSLFDICEIQNDENRLTNAMAYFMRQPENRILWKRFFRDCLGVDLKDDFEVERERDISHIGIEEGKKTLTGRIDLFITDSDNIVVIENKIKSDINTNRLDKLDESQLNRYKRYVEEMENEEKNTCKKEGRFYKERKHHFFILAPNYNQPHISAEMDVVYKRITYKDIYDYLNLEENETFLENDRNFKAFRDVIHRHTLTNPNGYLYYEMMDRYFSRIEELKTQNKKSK